MTTNSSPPPRGMSEERKGTPSTVPVTRIRARSPPRGGPPSGRRRTSRFPRPGVARAEPETCHLPRFSHTSGAIPIAPGGSQTSRRAAVARRPTGRARGRMRLITGSSPVSTLASGHDGMAARTRYASSGRAPRPDLRPSRVRRDESDPGIYRGGTTTSATRSPLPCARPASGAGERLECMRCTCTRDMPHPLRATDVGAGILGSRIPSSSSLRLRVRNFRGTQPGLGRRWFLRADRSCDSPRPSR
jgi:hypothetical protein